jgi:hypothetical protein
VATDRLRAVGCDTTSLVPSSKFYCSALPLQKLDFVLKFVTFPLDGFSYFPKALTGPGGSVIVNLMAFTDLFTREGRSTKVYNSLDKEEK